VAGNSGGARGSERPLGARYGARARDSATARVRPAAPIMATATAVSATSNPREDARESVAVEMLVSSAPRISTLEAEDWSSESGYSVTGLLREAAAAIITSIKVR